MNELVMAIVWIFNSTITLRWWTCQERVTAAPAFALDFVWLASARWLVLVWKVLSTSALDMT